MPTSSPSGRGFGLPLSSHQEDRAGYAEPCPSLVDLLGWSPCTHVPLGLGSPKWGMVSRCGLVVVPSLALQS